MSVINGIAKKYDGTAIDYVSIFNWSDGKCIAQVIPDITGAWEYEHNRSLNVGITYIANGCKPITHGPYEFIVASYKWWRLNNINERLPREYLGVAELRFYNSDNVNIATNPSKAFAGVIYNDDPANYGADKAFDDNPNTFSSTEIYVNWTIGYEFDGPVRLSSIGTRGRNDLPSGLGREWQTADVEVSDDGVSWTKIGTIAPMTAAEDTSLIIKPIIFI